MNWPAGEAAFVTGGASGIGLGIARALVAAGAKVAIADRDATRLAEAAAELTAAGGTVTTVQLDVADVDAWAPAADQAEAAIGPISILVNNAGVASFGPLDETPVELWRLVLSVNADAQFYGIRTFVPRFKERGGRAHVLNTASMAGLVPMSMVGPYVASKFASVGLSAVLRDELRGTDVGVSVLCPGAVNTRISATSGAAQAEALEAEVNTAAVEANQAMTAQGADPDEVGQQVLEAIRDGQFVIVTHPDWEPLVVRHQDEIRSALHSMDGRYGVDLAVQAMLAGTDAVTA